MKNLDFFESVKIIKEKGEFNIQTKLITSNPKLSERDKIIREMLYMEIAKLSKELTEECEKVSSEENSDTTSYRLGSINKLKELIERKKQEVNRLTESRSAVEYKRYVYIDSLGNVFSTIKSLCKFYRIDYSEGFSIKDVCDGVIRNSNIYGIEPIDPFGVKFSSLKELLEMYSIPQNEYFKRRKNGETHEQILMSKINHDEVLNPKDFKEESWFDFREPVHPEDLKWLLGLIF